MILPVAGKSECGPQSSPQWSECIATMTEGADFHRVVCTLAFMFEEQIHTNSPEDTEHCLNSIIFKAPYSLNGFLFGN